MDTLTIGAITKIVTDYFLRACKALKLNIPGWAAHLIVVAISGGVCYGYTKVYGMPFNLIEVIKTAFAAVGIDQFANEIGATVPNTTPSHPVITPK